MRIFFVFFFLFQCPKSKQSFLVFEICLLKKSIFFLDLKTKLPAMPCVGTHQDLENVTFQKFQGLAEDSFLNSILIKRNNNAKNSLTLDVLETQTDLKVLENVNNLACQLQKIKICVNNVMNQALAGMKKSPIIIQLPK